uniref:Uncharacterized protein n=2 Tax=Lepeophtheirus salmonis TaxID=72036 RepID=A0A0K2V7U0_LEPSM
MDPPRRYGTPPRR